MANYWKMMNRCKYAILSITTSILIISVTSCKSKSFHKDYYQHDKIEIPHYFLRDCVSPKKLRNCDNGLSDSLFSLFSRELYKLNLPISINISDSIENKMSVNIWKNGKDYRHFYHNKIDTSFILQSIPDSDNIILIPVIDYTDNHDVGYTGTHYYAHVGISIFIIKNRKIIYSMSRQNLSNSFFYVNERELDKSQIDVNPMWEKVVKEVMQPYMERLK